MIKRLLVLLICTLLFVQGGMQTAPAATIPTLDINNKNPGSIYPGMTQTLQAPGNLTADSPEVGVVVLRWTDNSTNETGFTIERRSGSDDTYYPIDNVGPNVKTYEQSELSQYAVFPGEDYYYRVKAYNQTASSGYSNEAYIQVMANIPSPNPPAALRAKGMKVDGRLTVRLFWADTANNEDKYVVQRSKAGGGFVVAGELPADSFKFEDPADLERNVKYTYRVIAYNSGGAGVSNTADVVLPDTLTAPVFNYVQNQGSTFMLLTWIDRSDNEDGFKVTRYGDKEYNPFTGETPPDKEYLLEPNATSLLVTELTPAREYGFEIVAYNAIEETSPNSVSGITGPSAPTSLAAIAVSPYQAEVSWVWNGYGAVNGFSIERKKAGGVYAEVGTAGFGDHSFEDALLLPGTQYFYRARAWTQNTYGNFRYWSDYSNEISIITPGQSTTNVQSGLTGSGIAKRKVISFTLGQKNYQVDGETLHMDTAAVSQEGRAMLPVRYLAEPLGASVAWDAAAQRVTVSLRDKVIELQIGNNTALINGKKTMIDPENPAVAPMISAEGRTLLPMRFISENLGCQVEWDPIIQEVKINYTNPK